MANQEKINRLIEIEKEIEALIQEGVKIADEESITFDLSATTFSQEYAGYARYVPEYSEEADERRTNEYLEDWQQHGWLSSSSDCN